MNRMETNEFSPLPFSWTSAPFLVTASVGLLWVTFCLILLVIGPASQKIMAVFGLGFVSFMVYLARPASRVQKIDLRDESLAVQYRNGRTVAFNLKTDVIRVVIGELGATFYLKSGKQHFGLTPNQYERADELRKVLDELFPVTRRFRGDAPKEVSWAEVENTQIRTDLDSKTAILALGGFILGMFVGPWLIFQFAPGSPKSWVAVSMFGGFLVGIVLIAVSFCRGKQRAISPETATKHNWISTCFVVAIFLGGSIWLFTNSYKLFLLLHRGQIVEALVVREYECYSSSSSSPLHSCIDYEFEAVSQNGESRKFQGTAHTWNKKLGSNPAKSSVKVRYVPGKIPIWDMPSPQDPARMYSGIVVGFLFALLALSFGRSAWIKHQF